MNPLLSRRVSAYTFFKGVNCILFFIAPTRSGLHLFIHPTRFGCASNATFLFLPHFASKHSGNIHLQGNYYYYSLANEYTVNRNQMTCLLQVVFQCKVLPSIACGLPAGLNVSDRNILICKGQIMILTIKQYWLFFLPFQALVLVGTCHNPCSMGSKSDEQLPYTDCRASVNQLLTNK